MDNKLLKILKLIGGVIVGLLTLIGFGTLLYLFFSTRSEILEGISAPLAENNLNSPQIVSQETVSAAMQFVSPTTIWGTRYLVLPIGFPNHQIDEYKHRSGIKENTLVNVAIVNEQTGRTALVFNRPMTVSRIDVPRDSSARHRTVALYTTFILDSDSNRVINSSDNAVLFSSALDGSDSRQITPDSLSVIDYDFIDHETRLRITLAKRPVNKLVEVEDWEHTMLWYDLKSQTLANNEELDGAVKRAKKLIGK